MSHNKLRGNESGCILEPGCLPSSRLFPATHLLLTAAAPQSLYTGDSCLWHFDYSRPALQRFFLENIFHLDKLCVDLLKRSVEPIGKFGLATDAVFPPTAVALLSGRSFFGRSRFQQQLQPRSAFYLFPALLSPVVLPCRGRRPSAT